MKEDKPSERKKCGIVMPISSIDNCSAEHWTEVLNIIKESVKAAGFEPILVSDADDSGIIQRRIIQNLYDSDIVICDVSGKNPNVMFELGIRLAFDKPTIIIKDDKTDYSFDTSVIEHLNYPRDLRFYKILSFKELLQKKIQGTYDKSINDENYTTFLKNFGEYKIVQLEKREITSDKYILEAIKDIKQDLSILKRSRDIHTKMEFDIEKANIIVKEKVKQFLDSKNMQESDLYFNDTIKDELINYLEDYSDVREICLKKQNLKKIVEEIIAPF